MANQNGITLEMLCQGQRTLNDTVSKQQTGGWCEYQIDDKSTRKSTNRTQQLK